MYSNQAMCLRRFFMPKFKCLLTLHLFPINKCCRKGTIIMETNFMLCIKRIWAKGSVYFLAFFWTFSIFTGVILGSKSVPHISSLMLSAASGPMSISGMFLIFILPLVFSVISIRLKVSFLIVPLAIIKGFFYGFLSASICVAFGSAGWLICLLFMFATSILTVILLWFWFKYIYNPNSHLMRDLIFYAAICIFLLAFDMFVISPFLSVIILYY